MLTSAIWRSDIYLECCFNVEIMPIFDLRMPRFQGDAIKGLRLAPKH